MRDYQKYATIVAVFATVLYAALLVAAFGMISLATNLDVIADRSAGPLVGPTMAGVATAAETTARPRNNARGDMLRISILSVGVARRPSVRGRS